MSRPLLPGTVVGAPVGALGCDTTHRLSVDDVKTLVQNGFKFCVRYVNYPEGSITGHGGWLTSDEAKLILDGGLALMVVQAAMKGTVTADNGTARGKQAADSCLAIGLPSRVNVWLDLESVNGDIFGYANNWYTEVANHGYVPGVYVGANVIGPRGHLVTEQELSIDLRFQHYWRSCSQVPDVERRYQMIQLYPPKRSLDQLGFEIDIDVTLGDFKAGSVQWLSVPERACVSAGRGPADE